MKILKLTSIALLALSLGITSCKKEEKIEEVIQSASTNTDSSFPSNSNDFLSLKLNGSQFNIDTTYIAEEFGGITITSMNITGTNIGLKIQKLLAGTYNITSPNNFGHVRISNGQTVTVNTSFQANSSGTLTIIEHNLTTKFIKGTFNFIATDNSGNNPQSVTNGMFQANY